MHLGNWHEEPATTPTGVAVFAEEVAIHRYAEYGNNIVHWTEFERGGHSAAVEAPELLIGDIREFSAAFADATGCDADKQGGAAASLQLLKPVCTSRDNYDNHTRHLA